MRQLLTALLDSIFPPSPETKLVRSAAAADMLAAYQPGRAPGASYLTQYHNPLIKAAITENKFHHSQQAAKLLGALLTHWAGAEPTGTLFIPIPLGAKRKRARGHNQVESVLRAAYGRAHVETSSLIRTVETTPQSHLKRADRLQNVTGAFAYTGGAHIYEDITRVVLLDDVITTGSTMAAARATLAPHLPSYVQLHCVALAH